MQRGSLALAAFGVVTMALGAHTAGCFFVAPECELCGIGAGSGSTSASSTTSSSSSGSGGTPTSCIPSESTGPVAESCGVFVSSSFGSDTNEGTKAKPFKSIGAALMKVDVARSYVCGQSFSEAVVVDSAVELYGAVDCLKGWAYDPSKKTTLTAAEDMIPLTLGNMAGSASVEDFAITAAAAKAPGGSSIAVLANGATASFMRCDLASGDADPGTPGVDGGKQAAQAQAGTAGDNAGLAGPSAGGIGGTNATCAVTGGKGGDGGAIMSGDGGDGFQGDGCVGGAKGTVSRD